ncbi:membrane integrity-associated transporter subunit PqiC [Dyella sp. LX-66]|uniref:ABC-type transport auxiliary lipoprotein family protein n=1 Tax=unclassified Dyella TaxID=2634549 RepID=UPI001BDFB82E|nr:MULTISPECIES: ABC-type transport auxiliary lipoprotein family protein [unclassified Dyella]MBT2116260.1 membrane integrity-associated transporter subunit PqiC [Dyella sp. LX-1]MBT2138270.1 membrane integrity-associated transporter subunit PqiC [Dyella sp. LX-66]
MTRALTTAARRAPLLAALLAIAACSVLPKAESPDVYRLPAAPLPQAQAGAVNWSLRVETPQAERMLDSARIAVLPEGDVVSVYKGARWSDRVPVLLRNRLLEGFRNDGRIAALSSDDTNLQADYVLSADLTTFQSEYRGKQPVVVLRYDARLVRNTGLKIVAARRFEVTQPVNGTGVPQVVAAFGQAGDALAAQVVGWTLEQRAAAARD